MGSTKYVPAAGHVFRPLTGEVGTRLPPFVK